MKPPQVHLLDQGLVRGLVADNIDGSKYFSFQGMPYAEPPLRELRFKAPQPPTPWSGIWDATKERDICASKGFLNPNVIVGSEDCLYINVYTQTISEKVLRPVMVWIHGGAFQSGSGNRDIYGPDLLLSKDVVFVTFNYRTGALGFLAFDDPSLDIPGNAGLKDMVMALKWVQKNISKFCGDPNNVTIFGESAGGASVHFLTLSPVAKDLFHKAISLSGSATNTWSICSKKGLRFAKFTGCDISDNEKLLKDLRKLSTEQIIINQAKLLNESDIDEMKMLPVGPVIENSKASNTFLTEDPSKILEAGRFNKVPMIMGFSSDEGLILKSGKFKVSITPDCVDCEKLVPPDLNCTKANGTSKTIGEVIKDFYYDDKTPSTEGTEKYFRMLRDIFMLRGIDSAVKIQSAKSNQPIFYYEFSVDAGLNFYKKSFKIPDKGCSHADILGYIFVFRGRPPVSPGSLEDKTVKRLITFFTNFAKNGDPNPTEDDADIKVLWRPVTIEQKNYLKIGEELVPSVNPEERFMKFWEELPLKVERAWLR